MYIEQTPARELRDDFVKIVDMDWTSANANINAEKASTAARVTKRQCHKYTEQQLFRFVFEEDKTAAEAARATGIVFRTGQNYVRKARLFFEEERIAGEEEVDSDEEIAPPVPSVPKERKHGKQKLFQAHSLFFLDFFEKHADATLNQAREAVMNAFPSLEIAISAISKHIKKHCNLTMKTA
ncbi:hypothetical protein A0J61_10755 [Choanephora cucurbitarum]|uniref:Uncharacterized protein n=1 Tax=Choanephora cucurbitarum TaxID=101091 RepID=A0A1C7MXP8_9FUNG|nr:hypothetical protein A0J61_10755 [Choanephora cucurbitarum]